jgi:WXG100 family type VII secretion target
MAITQAEAAVMASTADRFDAVNTSLQSMLRRLEAELDALRTQWQGAGGRSFEQVRLAWAAEQGKLHRALADTSAAMRSAASHYAATDDAASSRLAPVANAAISLPL